MQEYEFNGVKYWLPDITPLSWVARIGFLLVQDGRIWVCGLYPLNMKTSEIILGIDDCLNSATEYLNCNEKDRNMWKYVTVEHETL